MPERVAEVFVGLAGDSLAEFGASGGSEVPTRSNVPRIETNGFTKFVNTRRGINDGLIEISHRAVKRIQVTEGGHGNILLCALDLLLAMTVLG
jgi:hypothetical protein